jgi:hypothetical protein
MELFLNERLFPPRRADRKNGQEDAGHDHGEDEDHPEIAGFEISPPFS